MVKSAKRFEYFGFFLFHVQMADNAREEKYALMNLCRYRREYDYRMEE